MNKTNDNMSTDRKIATIINNSWAYNKYCCACGKFLYTENLIAKKCIKCNHTTDDCVTKPIPFSTSATATEKIIEHMVENGIGKEGLKLVFSQWVDKELNSKEFKQRVCMVFIESQNP